MKRIRKHRSKEVSADLQELLRQTRPTEEVLAELEKEKVDFDQDPEFVADFLKSQFVEWIYEAMEEKRINKNQLAAMLAKSRQYVGRILNETANFTIETMAEISCALGKKLEISMTERQGAHEKLLASKAMDLTTHRGSKRTHDDRDGYILIRGRVEVRHAQDLAA
jgi:transcriptional regulator with XRE-family HTH domain